MVNYNLTDIHFHTNDSFDAYEHIGKDSFNLVTLIDSLNQCSLNEIKLMCKTDHNVFNYSYFEDLRKIAETKGVSLLPGIEINSHKKVHWLFIFDAAELSKIKCGKTTGELLDDEFKEIYHYSVINGTIKERREAQDKSINVETFIKKFNELELSYLAIPHFAKNKGFYDEIKTDNNKMQLLNYMILDNIIVGFESKNQEQDIILKIQSTERNLAENIMKLESGEIDDIDEVERRQNHLNLLNDLKEMFDKNDTSIIYGSDFHGCGLYEDTNLFYIKSEANFDGLKFALLDPYSRVFSNRRLKKFDKESNYIIDKIFIKGYDYPIEFGDGLNSIIGPRGSGKTYLLNALIGSLNNYNGSEISKKIILEKIVLQGDFVFNQLDSKHYDIITQKNSLVGKKSMNIYNILSEAPYNYDKFSTELAKNFSQDKTEKLMISDYFGHLNNLIDLYSGKYRYYNANPDYSFIDNYNQFYKTQSEELKLNSKFIELFSTLERVLDEKKEKHKKLLAINETVSKTKIDLDDVSKYKEVEAIDLTQKVKDFSDKLSEYPIEIHQPLSSKFQSDLKRISSVSVRLKSINNKLKDQASNNERVLSDSISKLLKYVRDAKEILRNIKDLQLLISDYPNTLKDRIEYTFTQDEFTYIIRVEKNLNIEDTENEYLSEILNKYNVVKEGDKSFLKDHFHNKDYGHNFKKVFEAYDKRYKSYDLEVPKIKETILLKVNEDDYKEWDNLSPGQRSDILLNIILDTSSKKILIIDQPEDDLDNEMIYKTIVKKLRKLKHKKQIIVVSHNANVVITGDSDLIITCQNYNNNFKLIWDSMESRNIYSYSSMNTPLINDSIINIASLILDGGKEALKRRVKKMGYKKIFFEQEG